VKKPRNKQKGPFLVLYRVLWGIAFVLVLCIAGGTVYALLRGPGARLRVTPASPREGSGGVEQVFTGIGRIRALSGGSPQAAVILAVSFPYDPGDRFFAEELSAKVGDFRRLSVEYFASLSAADLARLDEGTVKAELLSRYNALLRLGRIDRLYFNEYMIIE
jgi:flagellar basal body-associated protein FliL